MRNIANVNATKSMNFLLKNKNELLKIYIIYNTYIKKIGCFELIFSYSNYTFKQI